jgi:hypothetical protein
MGITPISTGDNKIEIITIVKDEASEPLKKITKTIDELGKKTRKITTVTEDFQKGTKRTSETMEKGIGKFKFAGLNYLFFGMALQRTFGGMEKSATDTFRSITEATYGVTTNMTALAAAGEFMSYTLGDALNTVLEPFMPVILGITEAITDFVQQHPEVAFGLIAASIAGMSLYAIGVLMTFFQNVGIGGGGLHPSFSKFLAPDGGLAQLGKIAAAGLGIAITLEGIDKLETDFALGISKMTQGAGLMLLAGGKTKAGAAVYTFGIAAEFVDELTKNNLTSMTEFITKHLGEYAIVLAASGQYWTLPIVISFVVLDQVKNFLDNFGIGMTPFTIPQKTIDMFNSLTNLPSISAEDAKKQGIPTFQEGGYVPKEGLAYLHAGETVVPTNQTTMGNINVTINVTSTGNPYSDGHTIANEVRQVLGNWGNNATIVR